LIFLSEVNGAVRLRIYVQPGASRTAISGVHGDALKIKIKSPPEDGRANAELVEFLADLFEIAKSYVQLISGQTSRRKLIHVSASLSVVMTKLKPNLPL
jgi:uncharacterized protein (TIGR00251 family)